MDWLNVRVLTLIAPGLWRCDTGRGDLQDHTPQCEEHWFIHQVRLASAEALLCAAVVPATHVCGVVGGHTLVECLFRARAMPVNRCLCTVSCTGVVSRSTGHSNPAFRRSRCHEGVLRPRCQWGQGCHGYHCLLAQLRQCCFRSGDPTRVLRPGQELERLVRGLRTFAWLQGCQLRGVHLQPQQHLGRGPARGGDAGEPWW